jgi:glutamate racemase
MHSGPVGVFDSGVGGLSVLRHLRQQLPHEDLLYLADQAHVPYGPRPMQQIRDFSAAITNYLIERQAKLIVVACNTASAAALQFLRHAYPGIPFVGMEPAIRPAAAQTSSQHVGVLATPATFQGELFASVVERFAAGVIVHQHTLPGLVDRIEAGDLDGAATQAILRPVIDALQAEGVDTLVLACTHYPFVIPAISRLAGDRMQVIDPSPAVARQAGRQLEANQLGADAAHLGTTRYITTGELQAYARIIEKLVNLPGEVKSARWEGMALQDTPSPA